MIEMLKKQLELLKILVALKREKGGSATAIQKAAGIGNYYATKTILNYLKERGLVIEDYEPGPPGRFIYSLTDKGKRAAELAEELLEILGESVR
jgi:predicted transcriptional regulator